jgi:c-di-GMP-binding flagellar brake protein YcgR
MIEIKIDALYNAVKSHVTFEMRPVEESEEEILFFSKFIKCDIDKGMLVIDFPIASAALKALKINDEVEIKFIFKESPFVFRSRVLGFTQKKSDDDQSKRVMVLTLPESIMGEERREFMKVTTPPFKVTARVVESKNLAKKIRNKIHEAIVINISGGGIAFEHIDKVLPLEENDFLDIQIQFPEKSIPMEGQVLNIYQFADDARVSFGIKFIQKHLGKLEFKKSVSYIMRYVTQRERQLLSRR